MRFLTRARCINVSKLNNKKQFQSMAVNIYVNLNYMKSFLEKYEKNFPENLV